MSSARNLSRRLFAAAVALAMAAGPLSGAEWTLPRSGLARMRLGAESKRWFGGWKVAVPVEAFAAESLAEAATRARDLGVDHVEVRGPIARESETVAALRDLKMKASTLVAPASAADADALRAVFQSAKALASAGSEMPRTVEPALIVARFEPASLAALETLADEHGVDVALQADDPKALMAALQDRSPRLGVCADLPAWTRAGQAAAPAIGLVKDRLKAVRLDRATLTPEALLDLYRSGPRPLRITIASAGSGDATALLAAALDTFETALVPAMRARLAELLATPEAAIQTPDALPADMRKAIEAAIPSEAPARPKKPRKILVLDVCMGYTHKTIPHGNLMLDLLGRKTGAYEAVFSNDLGNLRWEKIRQFDAVVLNSVVGMVFQDPEVRDGLMRFVREGGGLGGIHGASFAAMDWPEFTEMIGAGYAPHRVETLTVKIDDPTSPLNAPFKGQAFTFEEEFYRFVSSGPYSRERLHVLLSIDVPRSDIETYGKTCAQCLRADGDYGLAWIKTYGKGRVFYTAFGHTPALFTTPALTQHVLAGLQFITGDLDADATPSALAHRQ